MVAAIAAMDYNEAKLLLNVITSLPRRHQEEMPPLLRGFRWDESESVQALSLGLIDKIDPLHPGFGAFMGLAKSCDRPNFFEALAIFDFANPALTTQSIERLWHAAAHPASDVQDMLSLNPNAPASMRFNDASKTTSSFSFLTACAKYGDLKNQAIVSVLQKHIFEDKPTEVNLKSFYEPMCRRADLPPDIVSALAIIAEGNSYWELAQNKSYRAMCQTTDTGESLDPYFGRVSLRLHPDVSNETLNDIFDVLETTQGKLRVSRWETEMARLAAHPNSDKALISRFFAGPVRGLPHGMDFPRINHDFDERDWTERVETGAIDPVNVARAENCSSKTLGWAFAKSIKNPCDQSLLLTHKNFPWADFDFKEACKTVSNESIQVVRAARFLSGSVPLGELASEIDGWNCMEALFAPNLSSRQITKIVAKHADLAVLAAIHPNAENIDVPAEHRETVEIIQPPRPVKLLAGKKTDSSGVPCERHLEI